MGVAFGSTDMQLPGILVHPSNVPCEADCASIFLGLDDAVFRRVLRARQITKRSAG